MSHRRSLSHALFLTVFVFARVALAGDSLPLKIEDAWVRAVPGSVTDTAAGMLLETRGDVPLRLTGAKTQIATMAMLMETTHKTVQGVDMQGMRDVDFIEIPAHGETILKPGGYHLMLMNMASHPQPGEIVPVTLEFEPGHRTVTVKMPARIDAGS